MTSPIYTIALFQVVWASALWHFTDGFAFHPIAPSSIGFRRDSYAAFAIPNHMEYEVEKSDRRSFITTAAAGLLGGAGFLGIAANNNNAWAVDVSGLRVEGDGGGNPGLASQLKSYDGSSLTRVQEAKTIQESSTAKALNLADEATDSRDPIATWAYRANPGMKPSLTRAGALGNLYRYRDSVQAPVGSRRRAVGVQFEFPSDWLQLDRTIGGIQYVDQRNGDKLYVFRAPLPGNTTLETVSKATIGNYIFDSQASLAKSGQTIEDYKVSSAQMLSDCPNGMCAPRRRFKIKYATLTGNGLRVERRALVDAYQVENDVYMLMTSSNAVKFEQKDSPERETVENIVSSFQIDA